jgi:hypothetical protein
MSHIPPFEQVLGLGVIGAVTSVINMNESLKFLILLVTFIGVIVKLWEQIKKSEFFLNDVKNIWRNIFKK